MVQPTPRPFGQRIAMSALAGLVVALLAMTALGVANADSAGGDAPSFIAAEPLLGDLGLYSFTYRYWDGTQTTGTMTVQWREGDVLPLPDGSEPRPNLLGAVYRFDSGDGADYGQVDVEYRTYHSGSSIVASGVFIALTGANNTVPFTYIGDIPVGEQQVGSDGSYDYVFFDVPGVAEGETTCLADGFAGQTVSSRSELRIDGCVDSLFWEPLGDVLQPRGAAQVGNVSTLRFRANAENVTTDIDLAPGISLPIQVASYDEGNETGLPWAVYTLIGFERGSEPLLAPPTTVSAVRPELEFVERTGPLLVDDTGVDHEFPLSEAFAKALTDPSEPGIAEWFAAHPDAVVADAYFEFLEGSYSVGRQWTFIATDGPAQFSVSVQRYMVVGTTGLPPALRDVTAQYVVTEQPIEEPLAAFTVPDLVPTSASLLALGEWHGSGGECYAYGEAAMDLLGEPGRRGYLAGTCSRGFQPTEPGQGAPGSQTLTVSDRVLVLKENGTAWAWRTMDVNSEHNAGPVLPSTDDPIPQEAVTAPAPRGSWAPSPAQIAGIGLFGLAAGLVTFLWLTGKGSLIGLFSRVQGTAVAEHPVRAKILQAIESQPGIHFRALQRLSGESNGNLVHHLGKLEKEGMVRRISGSGYTSYVLGSAKQSVDASPAARAPGARKLIDAARATPGASLQELAQATGLGLSTVHHHLARLEAAGAIRVDRSGKSLQVRVADS